METSSKALRLLLLAALLPISLLGGCRARQRTVQSSYAERDSLHTELRAQTQTASEAAYEENGVVLLLGAADADTLRQALLPDWSRWLPPTPPPGAGDTLRANNGGQPTAVRGIAYRITRQQRHTTGEVRTEQTDSTMRHNTATEVIARSESRSGRAPLGMLLGVLLATLAVLILLRVAEKRKGR